MPEPITLVLLPGLDGSRHLLEPFVQSLPQEIAPVVVTYPRAGPNSYEDLVAQVRECLPSGPFVLLGWSFSGPIALTLAAEAPAGLRGVVLVASFASNPHPALRPLRFLVRPAVVRLFPAGSQVKALAGGYGSSEIRRRLAAANASVSPAALAQRLREVLAVDVRDKLRSCPVPVLYLASTRDGVVPRRALRVMQPLNPTLQVAEIDGPHLALLTNAGAAAARVAEFISAATGGA